MRTYGCHRLIIQRCLRALTGTHIPINNDFQEILKNGFLLYHHQFMG